MKVRKATSSDVDLYFRWVNDGLVRINSFNQEPISYESHKIWFGRRLTSTNCLLLVFMEGDRPIGQVRFDIDGNQASIDYSIDSTLRGQGYGKRLIEKAISLLPIYFADIQTVMAEVKTSNLASNKIFLQSKFCLIEEKGNACVYLKKIEQPHFVIATVKPWNIKAFHSLSPALPGHWHLITDPNQLTDEYLSTINPRYIFFPHWNSIVPDLIHSKYCCVCFHMADVPYGRGGSPLQNLIIRGHKETKLTALRMVTELDAGPVFCKFPMSLSGSAQEIFERVSLLVYDMIKEIIFSCPDPINQSGDAVIFKRRKPAQSEINFDALSLEQLFDHIRMLDAESYPRSYINCGNYRLEFSNAIYSGDRVTASVSIRRNES